MLEDGDTAPKTCHSASEMQAFLDCPRKWSFAYNDSMRGPGTAATELGTRVHALLERYLRDGEPIDYSTDAGYIAETALPFLPAGGDVEHEFLLKTPKHRYYGLIDYRIYGKVFDHKTTSSLRWAKTPEQLQWDIQANLYAITSFVDWPELSEVQLQWTYMTTKGANKCKPVYATITREHAGMMLETMEEICDEIDRLQGRASLGLEPNSEMCEKYGGCPYRHLCNLGPEARLRSVLNGNK